MNYSINPQEEQDSIIAFLREQYPGVTIIPDGLLDDDNEAIQTGEQGMLSFIVLWFSGATPTGKGRSFANYKLDEQAAQVDVVVVARDGTIARNFLNDIGDRLTGFRTSGGGRVYKTGSMWRDSLNLKSKPSRWVRTDTFRFAVASKKVA